jgi:hypothetical protein
MPLYEKIGLMHLSAVILKRKYFNKYAWGENTAATPPQCAKNINYHVPLVKMMMRHIGIVFFLEGRDAQCIKVF